MEVKGLVWAGSATGKFDETLEFFRDVLGFSLFHQGDDLAVLRMASGDWMEVFGPGHAHFDEFKGGLVVEFQVDDVGNARAELEGRGVQFLHENHSWGDYVWAHFRGPDGNIYGITSGPYGQ